MADPRLRKIKRNATTDEIVEYLDYLCDRITAALENLDEENFTDEMKRRIGG